MDDFGETALTRAFADDIFSGPEQFVLAGESSPAWPRSNHDVDGLIARQPSLIIGLSGSLHRRTVRRQEQRFLWLLLLFYPI